MKKNKSAFEQLFLHTNAGIEEEKEREEDKMTLDASAQELKLFREEVVPVIKRLPSADQMRGGIQLHFSDAARQQWEKMTRDSTTNVGTKMNECTDDYLKKMRDEGERICNRIRKTNDKIALPPIFCYCTAVTLTVLFVLYGAIIMYNETQLHSEALSKVYWIGCAIIIVTNALLIHFGKHLSG